MMELLQGWLTVAGLSEHGTDSHNQGDRGSCPSASFSECQKSGVTSQSMTPHGGQAIAKSQIRTTKERNKLGDLWRAALAGGDTELWTCHQGPERRATAKAQISTQPEARCLLVGDT